MEQFVEANAVVGDERKKHRVGLAFAGRAILRTTVDNPPLLIDNGARIALPQRPCRLRMAYAAEHSYHQKCGYRLTHFYSFPCRRNRARWRNDARITVAIKKQTIIAPSTIIHWNCENRMFNCVHRPSEPTW